MNFSIVATLLSFALAIPAHYGCPPCGSSSSSCSSSSSSSCCCSSSSSSSETTYECCDVTVLNYDFKIRRPIIGVDWDYYTSGNFVANNGNPDALTYTCPGADLNSNPFMIWSAPSAQPDLDHYKWFLQTTQPIRVRELDTICAEFKASAQICKIDQAPFPCNVVQDEDVRLGAGVFSVFDPNTALNFAFLLTNDRVYGLYARNFGATIEGMVGYAVFVYIIPLKHRKACDIHSLKFLLNEAEMTISYHVDGCEKFTITRPGFYLEEPRLLVQNYGGVADLVFPVELIFGFGTMTFLDYYPACKDANCAGCKFPENRIGLVNNGNANASVACSPVLGCPFEAVYYDPVGTSEYRHIWGQGVSIQIGGLLVNRNACFAS